MNQDKYKEGVTISPIRNGTVIDHITGGEALNVLRILGITGSTEECVSVATHVESHELGTKDVVKIENRELRAEEVDRIALIAPGATINIIRDRRVIDKQGVEIPDILTGTLRCPNTCCITNTNEPILSRFTVQGTRFICEYCDTVIGSDISSYII
ncbi:MAG TPA: aspartate carbamoyltransferase regulatory subunit [Methanospirillum sp.]|nr:aspartate carbamoyltransferase regulatory subunit [Methanospirillum sp.]